MTKNFYEILGVSYNASPEDIKVAYRTLAKKYHPDVASSIKVSEGSHQTESPIGPSTNEHNTSDIENTFKNITHAYQTLSDPEKKRHYDLTQGITSRPFSFNQKDIFDDILKKNKPFSSSPKTIKRTLTISFLEAVHGTKKTLTLFNGRTIHVTIPAGIEEGQVLRLKDKKENQNPIQALVEVQIAPHPYFTRDGHNILLNLPISLDESILGGNITIPTPHGKVAVKLKPGTITGTTLRISQKGITTKTHTGDFLVTVLVKTPDKPDQELIHAIQEWAKRNPQHSSIRDHLEDA